MRCLDSSPLIEDCIFRHNNAENKGGGIYGQNAVSMVIRNCTFTSNVASVGGGIGFLGPSAPRVESCHFSKNEIGGMGGALVCEDESFATVVGCIMEENRAGDGGAVASSAGRILLKSCEIRQNVADFGGAVSCLTGAVTITDCTLSGDTALFWGGAVSSMAGSLFVSGTVLSSNFAHLEGGAVFLMDAFAQVDSSEVFDNSVGMSAAKDMLSGGFFLDSSTLSIHGSQIHGNGMAIYVDSPGGPPTRNADAVDNWWGDDTGPYHPILNPKGLGDRISDYVDFIPWVGMTGVPDIGMPRTASGVLLPNVPNPFGTATTLPFVVRAPGDVRISIFDVRGRLVQVVARTVSSPGTYSVEWDGRDQAGVLLPGGVYFCRMESFQGIALRKVTLLR